MKPKVIAFAAIAVCLPSLLFAETKFKKFAIGTYFSCGVTDGDSVLCWGTAHPEVFDIPADVQGRPVTDLTIGDTHVCALIQGQLRCWGRMDGVFPIPTQVNSRGVKSISVSDSHACVIDSQDRVSCWGNPKTLPVAPTSQRFKEISVGDSLHPFACGITFDGEVSCWGDPTYGALDAPKDLRNPRNIQVDGYNACVSTDSGVRCWQDYDPPLLKGVSIYTIGDGGGQSCASTTDGIVCWKMMYDVKPNPPGPPEIIPIGNRVETRAELPSTRPMELSSKGSNVCALFDGKLECWNAWDLAADSSAITHPNTWIGAQDLGLEYGDLHFVRPDGKLHSTFWNMMVIEARFGKNFRYKEFSSSDLAACAISTKNEIVCKSTHEGEYVPPVSKAKPPKKLRNPHSLSNSDGRACVMDGEELICWGNPVIGMPEGLKEVSQVINGNHSSCVLQNGKVSCWGKNALLDGNVAPAPAFSDRVIKIGKVTMGMCALTAAGKIHCWGDKYNRIRPPADLPALSDVQIAPSQICGKSGRKIICFSDKVLYNDEVSDDFRLLSGSMPRGYCGINREGVHCNGRMPGRRTFFPIR